MNIHFSAPRIVVGAEREDFTGETEGRSGPSVRSGCLDRRLRTCGSILNDINDLIDRSCGQCASFAEFIRRLPRELRDECKRRIPIGSITLVSLTSSRQKRRKRPEPPPSDGCGNDDICTFILLFPPCCWIENDAGVRKEGRGTLFLEWESWKVLKTWTSLLFTI